MVNKVNQNTLSQALWSIISLMLPLTCLLSFICQAASYRFQIFLWHLSLPLQFRHRFFCVTLIINSYCFIDILLQNLFALWSHLWLLPYAIPYDHWPYCSIFTATVRLPCFGSYAVLNSCFILPFIGKCNSCLSCKIFPNQCPLKILSHFESFLFPESVISEEGFCGEAVVNVGFIECQDPPNNQQGYHLHRTTHHTFPGNLYT